MAYPSVFDGHEEDIFARIAAGDEMTAIARSFERDRSALHRWLCRPEHAEAWRAAKVASSYAYCEKADAAVEELDKYEGEALTAPVVARAKLKREHYMKIAELRNREEFGEQKGPLLQLNMGDLHLSALQQGGKLTIGQQPAPLAPLPEDDEDEAA